MSQKTKINNDTASTSRRVMREGEERPIVIRVIGSTTITDDATLTMTMYKRGASSDLSATYFTGSMSTNGTNQITTKTTNSALRRGDYVVSVRATINGVLRVITVPLLVKRRSDP